MQPIDGLANFIMFLVFGSIAGVIYYNLISYELRKRRAEAKEIRQAKYREAEREYLEDMAKQTTKRNGIQYISKQKEEK